MESKKWVCIMTEEVSDERIDNDHRVILNALDRISFVASQDVNDLVEQYQIEEPEEVFWDLFESSDENGWFRHELMFGLIDEKMWDEYVVNGYSYKASELEKLVLEYISTLDKDQLTSMREDNGRSMFNEIFKKKLIYLYQKDIEEAQRAVMAITMFE